MEEKIISILVAALLVGGYLMIVQISAQNMYNRSRLLLLAVIELAVYVLVVGAVGWLYVYSGNDPLIIFGALLMAALAIFVYLIDRVIRNWRWINKIALLFFVVYAGCVFYLTIMGREPNSRSEILVVPFQRVIQGLRRGDRQILNHIILNVVMMVPLGILIPLIHQKLDKFGYAFLGGAMVSIMIETVQLLFRLGECDVDDIIANTLGAILGYLICSFVLKVKNAHRYTR